MCQKTGLKTEIYVTLKIYPTIGYSFILTLFYILSQIISRLYVSITL